MAAKEASRSGRDTDAERDYETYKMLLGLWQNENTIKTTKLQVLLAANALLVSAVAIAGGLRADLWYVYAAGIVFSLVWTFSIGRASLFQELWQVGMGELRARHPGDPRFAILDNAHHRRQARRIVRIFGGIPSRWYLIFSPLGLAAAWLAILIATR